MFNESFYLQMNPDVAIAVAAGLMSAQEHFELYGKFENRAPSPFFDPALYLRANPDVAEAVRGGFLNAFDHFMSFGQNEGRSPSVFFDPTVYLRNNPDVAAAIEAGAFSSPFEHFLLYGQNEIRNTAPFFDLKGYLDANPDVAAAVRAGHTTAFDHFINHGFAEDRDLGNGISLEQFAQDPKALAAIENGDYSALMSRVAEVAPFLPTYSPPAGYTVPSGTPLPSDFVPAGEEKLVVPPGVEAPDELPPNFQQPEPEPQPNPGGGSGGGGTPVHPMVKAFNEAVGSEAILSLLGDYAEALGIEADFSKFPPGGRKNAVGDGVAEVRKLFGAFKTPEDIEGAAQKHVETELIKQEALTGIYGAKDVTEFKKHLEALAKDRAEIIKYYQSFESTDTDARKRIDTLEEQLYTVALEGLRGAMEDNAEAVFQAFGESDWSNTGSVDTLVERLYEAHAKADADPSGKGDVAFLRAINIAANENEILAAIKFHSAGFANDLLETAFPDGGGREKAVGLGVKEAISLLGHFRTVEQLDAVIRQHIDMERNKAEFIGAVQKEGLTGDPIRVEEFKKLLADLNQDRNAIIESYFASGDTEAMDRAYALNNDVEYTLVLRSIFGHGGEIDSTQLYWQNLAAEFDRKNESYTGSIVDLMGQLRAAHDAALLEPI